jgi:hypothetical protein
MSGLHEFKPRVMENHDTPAARKLIALAKENGFKPSGKISFIRGNRKAVFGAGRTTFWTQVGEEWTDFKHYETETDLDRILSEELEVDPFADEHTEGT